MAGRTLFLVASLAAACAAAGSDIVFPDSLADVRADLRADVRADAGRNLQVPLDFMLRLSSVENFTDFLNFVSNASKESGIINLSSRLGDTEAEVPKNAVCSPQLQVVELIKKKDPSMLYFPLCTRLPRCGGCCSSELLKCRPTKNETINYTVYVSQFDGGNTVSVKRTQMVSVEKHTECRCGCAVQEEDCHRLQTYEADNCRCRCLNAADEKRCQAENDTKIWDSNRCMCACRQIQSCSTGYTFDYNTCSCSGEGGMSRRRVNQPLRRRSRSRPWSPVAPLDPATRRRRRLTST